MRIFLFLTLINFALSAKEIFPSFPVQASRDFAYRSATQRYVEYYDWQIISAGLRNQGVTLLHHNLFDRISDREEVGFIGYHGSTQSFRIYQDIIRLIIEEHCKILIRSDFHFFRIPGDPAYSYNNLLAYGLRPYDPNLFLCMNYAIYGNHINRGSSSYYYFTANSSANQVSYTQKIKWLFDKLKIDASCIDTLFSLGDLQIGFENGVIFQLFDASHDDPEKPYYALADAMCLNLNSNNSFSNMVQGTHVSGFANQIRMLLNNKFTLNPYSCLIVKRYDKLPQHTVELYMTTLRNAVRNLQPSQEACDSYRAELLQLWKQT